MKSFRFAPCIAVVLSGALGWSAGMLHAEVVASADASQFAPDLPPRPAPSSSPESATSPQNMGGDADEERSADDQESIDEEPESTKPYLKKSFDQLVESRDDLSRRLIRLGLGVDRYLAGRGGLD